ncbi:MAG: signal peptide peptidase SppA [Alphaproteobacteria bacterium]|nr:signal peptide peptidase SppA [Alphaproteobacteria bacterium]
MISKLWTTLLAALAVPLSSIVRFFRRRQLSSDGFIELSLSHDAGRRAPLDAIAHMAALLRAMSRDEYLRGVILRVRSPSLGWAAAQDLRRALAELRAAGKQVVVELEQAGNQELLLASAAEKVWLAPAGEVFLTGLGAQMVFYGDALARVGVQVDLEAAGAYKSFGEPYSRAYPSAANREAVESLVGDLGDQLVEALAEGRGLDPVALRTLMERAPLSADEALEAGLVDALGFADDVRASLVSGEGRAVRTVEFRSYGRLLSWQRRLARWGERGQRVGIVHLEGPVVHGTEAMGGSGHRVDADRVVPVLDELREDDQIAATVLFINSPGGSALASDLIAHAVERLAARKPVVAVMANVAASGGYYVAAPCQEILASPGTITGSIGVVGGKVSFGQAVGRLGVHHEDISTADSALMLSPWRAFTDAERVRFRTMLTRTYDRFIAVVAKGRGLSATAVEPHAQGRVWTGRQALDRGLVDALGGLDAGVARARVLGALPVDAPVQHLRFSPPRFRMLQQLLGREVQATAPDLVGLLLASLGSLGARVQVLRALPGQALALLPWVLVDGADQA